MGHGKIRGMIREIGVFWGEEEVTVSSCFVAEVDNLSRSLYIEVLNS
jgi:hypothetical protein